MNARATALVWIAAGASVFAACSGGAAKQTNPRSSTASTLAPARMRVVKRTVYPTQGLRDVAWLNSTTLIGTERSEDLEDQLHELSVATGRDTRVHLPTESELEGHPTGWVYGDQPTVLADGRIVITRAFLGKGRQPGDEASEIVIVDPATGAVEKVATIAMPVLAHSRSNPVPGIAWNHDHTVGYATLRTEAADQTCSTIVRVTSAGWAPLDLRVGDDKTGWDLGAAARTAAADDGCAAGSGDAEVSRMTSRAGSEVTFLASPGATDHRSSPAGANTPPVYVNLYSTQFGSKAAQILLSGISPGGWALSPDGALLVWCGKTRTGPWGCRVLDVASGRSTQFMSGPNVLDFGWRADSKSFAALDELSAAPNDLTIYDVSR